MKFSLFPIGFSDQGGLVMLKVEKPEWTPEDETLIRELATLPHFAALEKLVAIRTAGLNESHLASSDKEFATRIDEDRVILSEVRNRLTPRSTPEE